MPPILRRAVACALSIVMLLAGVGSMTFPQTPLDVDIELYYDGTWNNVNSYVYHRDMNPITITRGRTAEGKNCDPGVMTLTLNNRDGRFSPRNPNSPLFGKIGRNTQIRVSVTYGAVTYVRFVGEITSWPSRWDVSQKDVWVPIEAAGILRRLGQGSKPLRSPVFRAMAGVSPGDYIPQGYWPLEDQALATQFASGLANGEPMAFTGTPALASNVEILGSDPLPVFGANDRASVAIPAYTDADNFWVTQWFLYIPSTLSGTNNLTVMAAKTSSTTVRTIDVTVDLTSPLEQFTVNLYSTSGSLTNSFDVPILDTSDIYDQWISIGLHHYIDTVVFVGDTFVGLHLLNMAGELTHTNSVLISGSAAYGSITDVGLNGALSPAPSGLEGAGYGHTVVFVDGAFQLTVDDAQHAIAGAAHDGDTTVERFERLCGQLQIPFATIGTTTTRMGPERVVTQLQAWRDAEATEQGFLCERRDALGLQFRTNSSRYHQTPIALDYDVGHISAPFDPEPDDKNVANDREVKRRNGSQARRELTSGPLSVQDPPDGIGRYDDTITVDAYSDDQLDNIAGWRLHVGTWDAERYPRVKVDLAVPGNSGIVAAIAGADSCDLITIDNLPSWVAPETAELLIEGYRENIGFFTWDFTFNCSPAGPYNVVGVWGLVGKELHAAINSSVTSADIATTSGPVLATSLGSGGYAALIGAEEVQVTAVAASTVTFGVAGTVAHASNASVTPGIPASVATGNLLLAFAAIRNSGTGVPNTPSGYTRLAVFGSSDNCQLFAKIATSGAEVAPTISFTGGVANADTSAQMIRLAGKWHSASNILLDSNTQLNISAQNINYPGLMIPLADDCIILYLGWKQDDWTSVTGPGTEIGEPDTTTGDDQGIAWYYGIQTTAAAVDTGAFVVTGGAAAISRSAVLALRCDYQTATITRSVNGVSASHSAADAVTLARPSVWALA